MQFLNEKFCITGGTGSFGKKMVSRLLDLGVEEIKSFSRDEKNKMICVRNFQIKD